MALHTKIPTEKQREFLRKRKREKPSTEKRLKRRAEARKRIIDDGNFAFEHLKDAEAHIEELKKQLAEVSPEKKSELEKKLKDAQDLYSHYKSQIHEATTLTRKLESYAASAA